MMEQSLLKKRKNVRNQVFNNLEESKEERMGDALALGGDEGRDKLR